jgi:hypothetical protein
MSEMHQTPRTSKLTNSLALEKSAMP